MSARQRLTFAGIAVVIAVAAVVVLSGSGGSSGEPGPPSDATRPGAATTPDGTAAPSRGTAEPDEAEPQPTPERKPRVTRIRVRGGKPVGGVRELRFDQGERIRFVVTADVVDHVHLHGYDVMRDVAPGQPATFDVPARITGIFEAELEERGVPVAGVRVDP